MESARRISSEQTFFSPVPGKMLITVACAEQRDGTWHESVFCRAPNGTKIAEAQLDDGDDCEWYNPYPGQNIFVKISVNGKEGGCELLPAGHQLLMYRSARSLTIRSFPPMAVTVTYFTYPQGEQRGLWWYETPQGSSLAVATFRHGESGMIHSPDRDNRVVISLHENGRPQYGGILAPGAFLCVKRNGDALECSGFLVETQESK